MLVSLVAIFWMSYNAPPKEGGALRDIQKTAARETNSMLAGLYTDEGRQLLFLFQFLFDTQST